MRDAIVLATGSFGASGISMPETMPRIRILDVPPGEAPLWVREKWVGLVLPTKEKAAREYPAVGVLTSRSRPERPISFWLWIRGRGQKIGGYRATKISGYQVDGKTAVEILAVKNPEAAAWWQENTPHLLANDYKLLFHAHVCTLIDD